MSPKHLKWTGLLLISKKRNTHRGSHTRFLKVRQHTKKLRPLFSEENGVDLLLSKQQYGSLKSVFTIIESALQNKIDTAEQKANKRVITLALDELEDLAEYIIAEANHEEDKIRERKLDRLYDIVNAVLKREEGKERFKGIIGKIRDETSDG